MRTWTGTATGGGCSLTLSQAASSTVCRCCWHVKMWHSCCTIYAAPLGADTTRTSSYDLHAPPLNSSSSSTNRKLTRCAGDAQTHLRNRAHVTHFTVPTTMWSPRWPALLGEIQGLAPDVICLQEVRPPCLLVLTFGWLLAMYAALQNAPFQMCMGLQESHAAQNTARLCIYKWLCAASARMEAVCR